MTRAKARRLPDRKDLSREALEYMNTMINSQCDPVWFVEHVLGVKPFPKQADILRGFYSYKYANESTPKYKRLILALGQRCIDINTPIQTSNGLKLAKDITFRDELWDGEGWYKPEKIYRVGIKDAITIKTRYGFKITCSPEHKLLTKNGWKEAREISIDDFLLSSLPDICEDGIINLPSQSIYYKGTKPWKQPKVMTPQLAVTLGLLISEGTCNRENRIDFTNGDQENTDLFIKNISDIFGNDSCCKTIDITTYVYHSGIAKFVHGLGIPECDAFSKEVPFTILKAPSYIKRAFLSGYFEGDGCATLQRDGMKAKVTCATVSKKLARQIQLLLHSEGILSSIFKTESRGFGTGGRKLGHNTYAVVITGKYILRYKERVSFLSSRKKRMLDDCVNYVNTHKCRDIKRDNWVKVKSISFSKVREMIDFTMPVRNSYLAGGLIVHNSGKTALGGMFGVYEFFDICTLENPSAYYGLLKDQPIFIPVLAPSEEQVMDGVFGNIINMVENSEWVQSWLDWEVKRDEIISPSKHVTIKPFSSWSTTGRGRTAKAVIFDELDMFEDTQGKRGAVEVYSAMNKATDTLGMDGHSLALSSVKTPTGLMMTLYNRAEYESHTLAYLHPTWEVNPHLTKEQLMEEFKFDLPTFWRDYGCMPQMWSGLQFPEGVKLKQMKNLLAEYPMSYPDFKRYRVMAIDPAAKNDSFGVAIGWKDEHRTVIDGATRFRRKDGDIIIRPSFIRQYIKEAVQKFSVHTLVYDALMFPDIIEMCTYELGVKVEQHNVKKEDYDLVRSLMSQDKLDVVYDAELKMELEALIVKNEKKVDHPLQGSKDSADCVANVTWYLNNKEGFNVVPQFLMARGF